MNRNSRYRSRPGFSLLETLVCIGLIGMLMGLVIPAVQRARESALRAKCLNNLKQIGTALHNYESAHGRFPPQPVAPGVTADPNVMLSWTALILPQMEEAAWWTAAVAACSTGASPWENPPHTALAAIIPAYVCPDDGRLLFPLTDVDGRTAGYTSYVGLAGSLYTPANTPYAYGILSAKPGIRLSDVVDGTSTTLFAGERPPPDSLQAGRWYTANWTGPYVYPGPDGVMVANYQPIYANDAECVNATPRYGPGRTDNPCDRYHFWSLHPGGANWLFADCSVRFLGYSAQPLIDPLATYQGGEPVELP